nr:histone-lysine N-methyltransferase SETD1B isoform X1 [Halyomorpha halys]
MREEHLSNQFVTLPPPPKVFNSFQSNTEPVVQETTYLTTPTHIENIRYEHHNYDEENSRTVRSNVHSEVARSYINYTIPDSEYKAHSFDSKEDKSFDAQTEKKTSNINNTGKKNVGKPMNTRKNIDHQHIPINANWNHEIKMYPRMENNPTHFSFKQSLSKPETPIINVMDTPKQSVPTSHTKYNEVKKKIDKRDTPTKIDHKIIRSDKLHESRPSKNLSISSKSAYKSRNSEIDRSTTVANPSPKTLSSEKILHKSPGTKIFTTKSRKPQFEHQINCLNIVTGQEKSKIDNDVGSNCSISRVGFGTVGTKAPQSNRTDNTHDKHDDNDLITNNMIQQNSHRTTCDGNQNQDNAGVPGVLARGEPDDWRREAWEAGDVDYLGRDSFDNIWKRICECVGITAQTLSAPAAPAATSAGIANQPSAPETVSEKIIEPVSETVVDAVPAEKPAESVVPAQKPAEPPAGAEKPVEPLASVEKPVETVVSAEKPLEPVVSAEKSVESVVSAEKLVEPVASTEKPLEPVVSAEKSVEPAVAVEKPVEPAVSAEKPVEPAVAVQKPVEPVVLAEKPVEPAVAVEKPAETVTPTEKPAEPIVTAEKTTEPVVTAETLTAAVKPSESSPPVPENTPEAAPAAVETVVDKEKSAESTPSAEKPTESSKAEVISAEKTVEPVPTGEKSVIQEAPVVEKPLETPEKPAEPVTEAPIKATTAEKPVEPAVTLTKGTEAAPTDKKAEPVPTLEKPVEVATSSEKPAEAAPETVKPTETPEICPLKPSEPKAAAPGTPTSSEPSLKSGEARIQPPLVGEDAPVCKKEPGTPTITPPSGPASPQPADVPPEVCKLQATPSQPATPPASSHQTTDAPVPPKRKQGKNGKSGKGKK